MARLTHGGTPADFVVSPGALADVVDDAGAPVEPAAQGWAALLPSFSGSFDVYDSAGGTQLTDLISGTGDPVSVIEFSGSFDDAGQLPTFEGPDDYEGDVYLTPTGGDGTRWVRVPPSTDSLFSRVGAVEDAVDGLTTRDLDDVSATAPTDGQVLAWSFDDGEWQPRTAAGTGTVQSVNGATPDSNGDIDLGPSDVGAATAADMAVARASMPVVLMESAGGYPPKPSGFAHAIRIGSTQPTSQVTDGDIWLQPEQS